MYDLGFRLKLFLWVLSIIMITGTLGFMFTENLTLMDAFYFSIVTIATVGYGDIHPVTDSGKLLALFLILCGVGTFLGVVANATEMIVNRREKQNRLEKTNVIKGTFFSETGTHLLKLFTSFDPEIQSIGEDLKVSGSWKQKEFSAARKNLEAYSFSVDIHSGNLVALSEFLENKGDSLMRHLENPALMEHGPFSDLLHSIIHLRDEFIYRDDLSQLPDSDYKHLGKDIQRVYLRLVYQWLDYMEYLKSNYPYLFHLAVRINPFNPDASAIVD